MFSSDQGGEDEIWTPVADMMTALMVIFMVIVAAMTTKITGDIPEGEAKERARIKGAHALQDEFAGNLADWKAELDTVNLVLRFRDAETLFERGSAELRPQFKATLNSVVPALLRAADNDELARILREIRIEGHTSTEWNDWVTDEQGYLLNMELSQDRTREMLGFVLAHPTFRRHPRREEFRAMLTANGMSSSRPIVEDGREDAARSRRVEIAFMPVYTEELIAYERKLAREEKERARERDARR